MAHKGIKSLIPSAASSWDQQTLELLGAKYNRAIETDFSSFPGPPLPPDVLDRTTCSTRG
jgi:hypothetical protein